MTSPLSPASLLTPPIPDKIKRKRVLLVDTSQAKRELRAEIMRKLDVDVDCAGDIAEARSWWRAAFYDLVLINMEKGLGHRDRFCDDIRAATPPQRVAFLVGQPEYLAHSPRLDEASRVQNADNEMTGASEVGSSTAGADLRQCWGILEASRRISVVRSASVARTQAIRAMPGPPRDSERRRSKLTATPVSLDNLLKEELQ